MRSRINILVMLSICLLVSACEKAKMRTVPRQTAVPAAGYQSAPMAAPQADDADDIRPPEKTPRRPLVSSPAPAPAEPITRLDDSAEARDASGPNRALRRERTDEGGGELNRPRGRPQSSRGGEVIVDEEDCFPAQLAAERAAGLAPQAYAGPREPRENRREEREERTERRQQFELDPSDELHCRWEPTGQPMTYLKFDPATKTAWVQHGYPQKWDKYTQVRLVGGLGPFGEEGLSLVNKRGVDIAHLKPSGNGRISYERDASYPYESYFGRVPGTPIGENVRGVCWTKSEPAHISESGNTSSGN